MAGRKKRRDQVVVITGASGGIGFGAARAGTRVVLAARQRLNRRRSL